MNILELIMWLQCEKICGFFHGTGSNTDTARGVMLQWPISSWGASRCDAIDPPLLQALKDSDEGIGALGVNEKEGVFRSRCSLMYELETLSCSKTCEKLIAKHSVKNPPLGLEVTARHLAPALVNEFFRVELEFRNTSDSDVLKGVKASLAQGNLSGTETCTLPRATQE